MIMCYFFSLRGIRGGGWENLIWKVYHVGINPDIIKSAQQPSPLFPHIPPYVLSCTNYRLRERDKSREMSGLTDDCRRILRDRTLLENLR